MRILVYRYGLSRPSNVIGPELDQSAELVRKQLELAHRYRNTLTEIERGRRAAVRALHSGYGDVAALQQAVSATREVEEKAAKAIKLARSQTRSRSETDELKAALTASRDARRTATKALLEYRSKVRVDPEIRSATDTINDRAAELQRSARAHCGTYWGSYLLVEAEAEAARKAPMYDGHEANDPRFERWTGEGSLGVQIQGGMPSEDIFGNDLRLRIDRVDEKAWLSPVRGVRRRESRTTLHLRIGSDDRAPIWGHWPMIMHRNLPEKSTIKAAAVHVKKIGPREEWWLTVTVQLDDAMTIRPRAETEHAVAIDLGWRQIGDDIRVAAWRGEDGEKGEIRIAGARMQGAAPPDGASPGSWQLDGADKQARSIDVGALRKAEDLRSIRDKNFDAARGALVEWIRARLVGELAGTVDLPVWLREAAVHLHAWKSQGRLAALAHRWRDDRFEGDMEMFADLKAWQVHDMHLWMWESFQRSGALRNRREIYRIFAAKLARRYKTLVLEDLDLRAFARRPATESPAQNETARSNRHLAATSELRLCLINAFMARGGDHVKLPCENTTITCHHCGLIEDFDAANQLSHTCSGCGTRWDQDDNATENLLQRWAAGGGKPGGTGAAEAAFRRASKPDSGPDSGKQEGGSTRWNRAKKLQEEKKQRRGDVAKKTG